MPQQFETGHAKNLAILHSYNQFIANLGPAYNPPMASIKLTALETLYNSAKAVLDLHKLATETWKVQTNKREIAFGGLAAFSTRILGVLRSTNAPKQTIDDFSSLVGKIRGDGRRLSGAGSEPPVGGSTAETENPAPRARSSSQRSYDQRIEHFSKMILLLKAVPDYTPTEPDLTIAGLEALYTDLFTANSNATKAEADVRTARTDRNSALYAEGTGVIDLVKKSKAYVLGIYGRNSEQYRNAIGYKLTTFKS